MPSITKPKKQWFKMEGDLDKGEVELKILSPGEKGEVSKAAISHRIVHGDADMHTEQEFDPQAEIETFTKLCVTGWKNFFDDGRPLKHTRHNVVKAAREIDGFAAWVREKYAEFEEIMATAAEEQEKN